jgi:hypothetical protein
MSAMIPFNRTEPISAFPAHQERTEAIKSEGWGTCSKG